MRKGLTLALAVIALAVLNSMSFAKAPILLDVPGVIHIGDTDAGTGLEAPDVFIFSESVFDPDNLVTEIDWSFLEQDTDALLVNGLQDIASESAALSPGGLELSGNITTSTFSIQETGAAGVTTAATTMLTGTDHEAKLSTAQTATVITLYASDGTNVTAKDIAVTAETGASDSTGGISREALTVTDHSGFTVTVATGSDISGTAATGGVTIVGTAVTTFGPDPLEVNVAFGDGPNIANFGLEFGQLVRMKTHVRAVDALSTHSATRFRIRFGNGPPFDVWGDFECATPWFNQCLQGPMNDGAFGANGRDYYAFYSPPELARLDGRCFGPASTIEIHYDVILLGGGFASEGSFDEGSLVFSDTVLDVLDRPTTGSNGALRHMVTDLDFATSSDDAFNESAPGGADPPAYLITGTNPHGWVGNARSGAGWATIASHQDQVSGTGVDDSDTTCGFGNDQLSIFGSLDNTNFSAWIFGDPSDTTEVSIVPQSILASNGDHVYYRAAVLVSADDDDTTNTPEMRWRFGNPFGTFSTELVIVDGAAQWAADLGIAWPQSLSGPTTDPVWYEAWVPGKALADWEPGDNDYNNLSLAIEMLDHHQITVGQFNIHELLIEQFPTSYFD